MALELEVEAETLLANPLLLDVLHALAARGRQPFLLSDMYLPPAAIKTLLRGAGIGDGLYRALYVSCVHGCSKQDGGLYRKLLADHPDLLPAQILHIGDDATGDVTMARANGLRALHYSPPPRYASVRERERSLAGLTGFPTLPLRRLAALAGRDDAPDEAFWLGFGSLVLGPAVVEYCRWVVEDCLRRGIGLIAPLMREADLFAPLMLDWIQHQGYDIQVKPLFVSREALTPLELAQLDGAQARSILTARPYLPWDRLLRYIGMPLAAGYEDLAGMTLERLAGHTLPNGDSALEKVLALFDSPSMRHAAAARAAEARTLIQDYLADRLGEAETVALVDLGARGSTPAAIACTMEPAKRFQIYLCYAVPDVAGPASEGHGVSVFCAETDAAMTLGRLLYRSPQILERALTGLSGTTLGYRRNDKGCSVPETAPAPAQGEEAHFLSLLQAGVRRYADLCLATHPPGAEPAPVAGEAALFPLAASLLVPTAEEADLLGALRYDHNDGTDLERAICDETAMSRVEALGSAIDGPTMSMALGLQPLSVPWPQGAMTRRDQGVFQRHMDALSLDLGHGVACRALVARVRQKGLRRVAVVAVGGDRGMGPDFIRFAGDAGLELAAYSDLMRHLAPPPHFHGVPVLSLESLPDLPPVPLVLVTLGYADRLAALLRTLFSAKERPLHLVALARPDLEETVTPDLHVDTL